MLTDVYILALSKYATYFSPLCNITENILQHAVQGHLQHDVEQSISLGSEDGSQHEYLEVEVYGDDVVEEDEDVVCSQPVVPFVGMKFDTIDEAKRVYNEYAWKLGFSARIASSRTTV